MQRWSKEHPDWPSSTGAAGPANVDGAPDDAFLLRIPSLQLGPFTAKSVAATSRPNGTFSATSYETPAQNGQVLFAGGETFDKGSGHLVPIADAELYTP